MKASEQSSTALPPIGSLTQRQQRGMDCLWCGIALTTETAVDLDAQPLRIWKTHWYPRACRRHSEPEDVMTTTVVRASRAVPHRDGDIMRLTFAVAPRRGDTPLSSEDACRVGDMRRIAAARLRYAGLEALAGDVMLIVSELLTNAVLHSGTTQIELRMAVREGFLRITVADGVPGRPEPKCVDDVSESGRGLALVDALAKENGGSWGTSDRGATIWCALALAGEPR